MKVVSQSGYDFVLLYRETTTMGGQKRVQRLRVGLVWMSWRNLANHAAVKPEFSEFFVVANSSHTTVIDNSRI